jgi:hypothetical protein
MDRTKRGGGRGGAAQVAATTGQGNTTLTRHCTARVLELPLEGHEQGLRVSDGLSDARVGHGHDKISGVELANRSTATTTSNVNYNTFTNQ